MRFSVLLTLLRMRYRLLWAQVRLRQGKIVLFIVGYSLVVLIGMLLARAGSERRSPPSRRDTRKSWLARCWAASS